MGDQTLARDKEKHRDRNREQKQQWAVGSWQSAVGSRMMKLPMMMMGHGYDYG